MVGVGVASSLTSPSVGVASTSLTVMSQLGSYYKNRPITKINVVTLWQRHTVLRPPTVIIAQ